MLTKAAIELSKEALVVFKNVAKDSWDAFTPEERDQVADLLYYTAEARLLELAGKDVGLAVGMLDAALLQWKVAGKTILVSAFKQTAREVFGLGGVFLGGLVRGVIEGM